MKQPISPNPEHLKILRESIWHREALDWNDWRRSNPTVQPDLQAASLTYTNLAQKDLRGANLRGADFHGSTFSGALLNKASLSAANLGWADLTLANLTEVDLTNADLRGAFLHNAILIRAKLHSTNLDKADLAGAQLYAADLGKANLNGAILRDARYDSSTIWPSDFDPVAAGATLTWEADESPIMNTVVKNPLNDFNLSFSSTLTPDQIKATLHALADYYRACGGAGFQIDFELEDVLVGEPANV